MSLSDSYLIHSDFYLYNDVAYKSSNKIDINFKKEQIR